MCVYAVCVVSRALWTFGPFPAATLIKYVLSQSICTYVFIINRNSIAMLEREQYSYVSTYITVHLQPAVIMLSLSISSD